MEFPVCDVCLSSDILCTGCTNRLENGDITADDVKVSRELFALSEKHTILKEAQLKRAVNADVLLLLAGKGHAHKLVGKRGIIVKELAKTFRKSVKVIEESDIRGFISQLLGPATLLGINTVYTQDGEKKRVRIASVYKNRMGITSEGFSRIIEALFGEKMELAFE